MNPEEAKKRSRGHGTDMSPEAITRRLEIVGELYKMGMYLKKFKEVEEEKPNQEKQNSENTI